MSKICQITGKKAMIGNNVSHSKRRTKRTFDVNLFTKKFYYVEQDCWISLNICANGLRVINKKGLDAARSGDRKHPQLVTEVKNEDGILIARYVDGKQDHSVEVQPVLIHVEHNGNGQTIDRTVRWLVDDTDLLENRSETGYTMKDASILPNMNSAFITNIINR